ncbi:glutamine synthetase family protein [Pseudomonas sp. GX19020]|uniref:glutamine synthetase family protein n=1 Tax=Pseudomonadota TaxID=1224 RepID=UPI000898F5FB|nr:MULTISPECIES: glutamine synthetase family protein [Pseudomonadota]MCL4068604.1 glutamine synthetase family protein [Pseudomonas sp. GX19020]SEC15702.1 L-glutamine synthetase [Rhodobacter sp. 24-YEA-8]
MPANLTLETLKVAFEAGEIDTVLVVAPDMQGRLMGKRFHAGFFLDSGYNETHCCNYLLALDMEMNTVPGYKSAGWSQGYGDYVMKPDLETLRRLPWLPGTAMVMCDLLDHHTHEEITISPRAILKKQVKRARAMGFEPMMATELEFYLFENSYENLRDDGFGNLRPISAYNEDYHIFQTSKEEPVMRKLRNDLYAAGIPVENTKGEADSGQGEVNYRYSDAMDTADNHTIIKQAVKEIAWTMGKSVTFMAKYQTDKAGSAAHVHQSLWTLDGKPAFFDKDADHSMSQVMRHFIAGQLEAAEEMTVFFAPYVNSYKRFCAGLFAPTKIVWSGDNRTAGFRVCGEGTKAVRVECRIPGSDVNPYVACAALLAAGLDGIERKLELEPEMTGDLYAASGVREIPKSLRDAAAKLKSSAMLRKAFGDDVVDHYHHAAQWEISETDRVVTDFELKRLLERA